VYAKVNPADAPVLTLAITSDTMPLTQVQNIVNTRLALKISQVNGVGLVSLSGGQRPAVRIQGDTKRWHRTAWASTACARPSRRPTPTAPRAASTAPRAYHQRQRPAGDGGRLQAPDHRLQERRARAPDRRGHVVDSAENTRLGAWSGKQPAIILNVQRQPGANVIRRWTPSRPCCPTCRPACRRP
jgi:multidrug efflux pump